MKNTKIVSTIGPATDSKKKIEQIVDAGVNVIRQNFSHVDHEAHKEVYDRVRDATEKTAVMADTKGPEIRLGQVKEGTELEKGHKLVLTTEEVEGTEERLPVKYKDLPDFVEAGDEVRIDDGKIELQVDEVNDNEIHTTIVFGGEVSSRKALNVPGKDIGLTAPTEKDKKDIRFAAKHGYDFISLSFVKKPEDIKETREILREEGSEAKIISKIEHPKAVENFDAILEETDAVMVARGDLGVETPAAELPKLQKDMIQKCNLAGKPVITATQMLESMTENPTATRAEISDVANAVLDGTDAVMLSGETAVGEYPVETVKFMAEVVREAESTVEEQDHHTLWKESENIEEIICKNAFQASEELDADNIVAPTETGETAQHIAKHRPKTNIVALTQSETVERQLQLVWGVEPYYMEFPETVDQLIKDSAKRLRTLGLTEEGKETVFAAGTPPGKAGATNTLQIRETEEILE
ncbi:MAG: pyruvate kinase [Candidatus Nanohaloarchaea archaeon]